MVAALIGFAVVLPSVARAQEPCPLNYIALGSRVYYYADAVKDTGYSFNSGFGGAGYDLVLGEFEARASADQGYTSGEAGASDDFTASGDAPGTPFTIRARLTISGYGNRDCVHLAHCSSGSITAVLREGPSNEASYFLNAQSGTAAIEVTVQGMVGVPFRIFVSVLASAASGGLNGRARIDARLDFADLPAGLRITSCQGYAQGPPVAVLRSTWGRLKSVHR